MEIPQWKLQWPENKGAGRKLGAQHRTRKASHLGRRFRGCQAGHSMLPPDLTFLISPRAQICLGGEHDCLSSRSTSVVTYHPICPTGSHPDSHISVDGIAIVSYSIPHYHSHLLKSQSVSHLILATLYKVAWLQIATFLYTFH